MFIQFSLLGLFNVLIVPSLAQNIHRRFEYKYSFKGPYLAQKDNQVPFWAYSGNAIASEESFRITPSLRSQKGQAWSKNPINFEWWEVEIVFRVNGRGRVGADGLALWYTSTPGVEGPVFGSSDQWVGFGLFFDSFDNDNKRNNPYIMGMVNDGTKVYDHEHDGMSQQIGGCLRDFRNKPFPIRAKIEYYKNVLTVKVQLLQYDYSEMEEENGKKILKEKKLWDGCGLSKPGFNNSSMTEDDNINKRWFDFLLSEGNSSSVAPKHRDILQVEDREGEALRPSKIRRRKSYKRRKRRKMKNEMKNEMKRAKILQKSVMIHNGMTDNEKDYEMCLRADNIFLPTTGHFGVTAATGGLADDHDVLRFLVYSLRSAEELEQLKLNRDDEERFQKEFEKYQEKTQKARDDYIAEHPDAAVKDQQQEYETSEQRELGQIFQGQAQIYEVIRQVYNKLDEIIGRQERTLSLVAAVQSGGQVPAGQQVGAVGDSIKRHEVDILLNNQREVVQNAREIKNTVIDIQQKSHQILTQSQMPQGSVQPAGGGSYDFHVTLKEVNEGLNIVKRDLGIVNQRLGELPIQTGATLAACPQSNCVSTTILIVFMLAQIIVILAYFMYRDSKEANAKKFY